MTSNDRRLRCLLKCWTHSLINIVNHFANTHRLGFGAWVGTELDRHSFQGRFDLERVLEKGGDRNAAEVDVDNGGL